MAKYANVLIASCDKGILKELRANVRELGLFDNVRLAFDGKEALNSIDAIMPELLIVDYILTNIDGLGVVEKVREKYGEKMRRAGQLDMLDEIEQGCSHFDNY